MRRYSKHEFEEYRQMQSNPDVRFSQAYRRVKRIKGFYMHLAIYLLVNIFLIVKSQSWNSPEGFWTFETFSTPLLWGFGLLIHGLSVFGREVFFGPNWENRKIQELMEKDKNEKWE